MENRNKKDKEENYFAFGEVLTYFFRKKDAGRKTNINLKMMHGINKISILVFLAAVIVLLIRHVF